jgi:hypothetical protein
MLHRFGHRPASSGAASVPAPPPGTARTPLDVSPPMPLPVQFALLPSLLPNKLLTPVLYVVLVRADRSPFFNLFQPRARQR